jgi:hypothetical protein
MVCSKSRKTSIGLILLITILLSATTIYAETGNLSIKLKSHDNLGDPAGVTFSFYKVGEIDSESSAPVFDTKYGVSKAPKTADELRTIINKMKGMDKGTPVTTKATASDGTLSLSMDEGVYYIEAVTPNDYGVIEPSLVWLPHFIFDSSTLSYDIDIVPKAEPEGDVEGQEEFPPDDDDDDGSVKGEEANGDDDGSVLGEEADGTKTSDDGSYYGYIGLALLSLLMLALILRKQSKRKERHNVL